MAVCIHGGSMKGGCEVPLDGFLASCRADIRHI